MSAGALVRYHAALAVADVVDRRRSLDRVLAEHGARTEGCDQGLLAELCYGTLRWYAALYFLLDRLLERPLADDEQRVRALLLVGLYQLAYLRLPAYAAVAASVEAARRLRRPWAPGLINAVLRAYQRRRDELGAALAAADAADAHPGWLRRRLRRDWPQHWQAVIAANNQRPPLCLRVNRRHDSRETYLQRLHAAGIAGRKAVIPGDTVTDITADAVMIEPPQPLANLPGFGDGRVSVQDAAAQLAAPLLAPRPGERLLDACAAPGGKTGHLLELAPEASLLALDRDPQRLALVGDNLRRLGLDAELRAADAALSEDWWDGRPFDAILLDAPCTGSGVIRRHPDIKLRRRAADITAAAGLQRRLLERLWPLLKPGGRLLYATCSVFRAENSELVGAFLDGHPRDAAPLPVPGRWGLAQPFGRQLLPGDDTDGFYYALLGKSGVAR